MSPCTTAPSGLVKSPNWNQMKVFRNWCRPITSNARLATPKMPEPARPDRTSHLLKLVSASPTGGQIHRHSTENTIATQAMMIGTSRRPLKNPSQSTSFVRWKRCQKYAVSRPITMPPKTPGFW